MKQTLAVLHCQYFLKNIIRGKTKRKKRIKKLFNKQAIFDDFYSHNVGLKYKKKSSRGVKVREKTRKKCAKERKEIREKNLSAEATPATRMSSKSFIFICRFKNWTMIWLIRKNTIWINLHIQSFFCFCTIFSIFLIIKSSILANIRVLLLSV